ncbi:MAG: host-nuclease inhibitor Gam family protein [Planctomycetota bacterium]
MATELLEGKAPCAAVIGELRRIAATQVRLGRAQAELDEALDAVRRRYDRRLGLMRRRLSDLLGKLEAYCRANRGAVLPPGRKSQVTPFGIIGFRKGEASLELSDGLSEDDVCRLLRAADLGELVRVKEAPDRPAIRKALSEGRLDGEQLRQCGIKLTEGQERFHCKVEAGPPAGAAGLRRAAP